jgi:predicted choloylglycine hydrolase
MKLHEAFSPEESKKIYDNFLAIVNDPKRRDRLVRTHGKNAENVAYGTAVNQIKKQAANNIKEPTTEEPMDKETKLKEMIQAALSKPLSEKKKSSNFTSKYDDKFDDKRKNLPDGLQKAILKKQGKLDEDLDIGHQDDEPHMIKAELAQIGKYAMELYKMVSQFEGPQEVDFPAWWQAKITTAKVMISSAKHYLEFELEEPKIDAMVDVAAQEDIIDEKLKPSMGVGAYVKDFRKSDAPQFKGKSKKKKQKMAVAAYLSAKDKIKEAILAKLKEK